MTTNLIECFIKYNNKKFLFASLSSSEKVFDYDIKNIRRKFKTGIIDKIVPCKNYDRVVRKILMDIPAEYL